MGTVYRAHHRKTGKAVAIKVVSTVNDRDSTFRARFEREIKLLSQFRHPNIVRIHGDSEYHGVRYYAMELIDGRPLDEILNEQGKLSVRRTIAYGVQICEALQEIHRVGVIHRDLKPANLMITNDHHVKLMDFGIAKDVTALHTKEITQADKTVGTVSYMSPEQLAGQDLTRKSDIYALGILLYRMLTGRLPFTGETMFDYMNQRMHGSYALPTAVDPQIPYEFDELIKSMLQQDPENRPRDTYVVMQKLLDINKKAKEGTLGKTKEQTNAALVETVEIPNRFGTLLRSVTDKLPFTGTQTKRKKKKKSQSESFFESVWFLLGCLLLVVASIAYAFWPASPDSLLAEAKQRLHSDNAIDWKMAIDSYLDPILERYPDSEAAKEAKGLRDEYHDKYLLEMARGKMRFPLPPGESAPNAHRMFVEATKLKQDHKFQEARTKFIEISQRFLEDPEQRGWALLAKEELFAEVHGQVYEDIEADGVKQPTDPGLAGWTIFHDGNRNGELDPGEPSANTDSDGYFSFSGLSRGTYFLRLQQQENWSVTAPPDAAVEIELSQSEVKTDIDFGVRVGTGN